MNKYIVICNTYDEFKKIHASFPEGCKSQWVTNQYVTGHMKKGSRIAIFTKSALKRYDWSVIWNTCIEKDFRIVDMIGNGVGAI